MRMRTAGTPAPRPTGEPAEPPAPEEHLEDLGDVGEPGGARAVRTAEGVVARTLLRIRQDLVGAGDFLEPLLRRRRAIDIGVVLASEAPIGLADVVIGRVPTDPEDLVEVPDRRHYCSVSIAASDRRCATARTAAIAEK